ncbi:unnamed protein product [Vitrella brassicaformis CCMP3155]|uniref:Uncharacterized protein n=1 Tax=Vitrella brassicaformis (strain CCMP3155) TaxID=1169540 RepID=A0A0G4F893_VITBC|nr:unnamed protein product [Vitrella brassicaformis CCMP3155]|eukprot:CEM08935.1 unnamed protein product [Vitrella brassicaformis CCMP3155]
MDVSQLVVANAQAVKDSLVNLQPIQDRIIAQLSRLLEQDAASIAAQASSPEALVLNHQLGSMASLLNALTTQLEQGEPGLTGAVDALTPTTEAQQHPEAQAPVVAGPSYRLIHRSDNAPPVEGPARRRLARDELANVFGHLQPWELTPLWRRLGTPLFHQSAANYTKLVIDCEDDTAGRMWETMPLDVAHKWGQRAANLREIKHRYPHWREGWCRGTWVALVEGHAIGRAAIAEKKRQKREGGEGAAASAAAVGQDDDDGSRSADEGTLEVLSFEAVELDDSIEIPDPPPSSDLPPAPTAPIHLPALTTVDNIANDCMSANDCMPARVGRQWHTPAVKSLTTQLLRFPAQKGGRSWLEDCKAIEVLHIYSGGRRRHGRFAEWAPPLTGSRWRRFAYCEASRWIGAAPSPSTSCVR